MPQNRKNLSYGLSQPFLEVFPAPIVANREPGNGDKYEIGQLWVFPNTLAAGLDQLFLLSDFAGGLPVWVNVRGGAGAFVDLQVTNDLSVGNDIIVVADITAAGNIESSLGNITATAGDVSAVAGNVVGSQVQAGVGGVAITNAAGVLQFTVQAVEILAGAGVPGIASGQGSLYLRNDGGAGTTGYINTAAGINWVAAF